MGGRFVLSRMMMSETIDWADFARIDIRVGTIVRAEPNASARKPALILWIEFGPRIRREEELGTAHPSLYARKPDRPAGCRRAEFSASTDRQNSVGSARARIS